jgi:hypothetical protein
VRGENDGKMSKVLVACNTIKDEVEAAIKKTGFSHPVRWVESGLHNNPETLKQRLQKELDDITGVEEVLLGFGFCGNSLAGLTPKGYRLIFPKADDCITVLLGSMERRKELCDEMGTYFLTNGWLNYERNIWEEYKYTVNKYGADVAEEVFQTLFGHYKRLGIIDTGAYDVKEFAKKAEKVAEDLKLVPRIIPGCSAYLEKLLTGPYDDDFVIINPGETVDSAYVYLQGREVALQ